MVGLVLVMLAAAADPLPSPSPAPAASPSPATSPSPAPSPSPAASPRYEFPEGDTIEGILPGPGDILPNEEGPGEDVPDPSSGRIVRPWIAGWSSAVFPGAGFYYLHRPGRAAAYLGVEALELGALTATVATSGYDPDDPETEPRLNRVFLPYLWLQNTHMVGIYDAYRAARLLAPDRYRAPVPEPDLAGLLRAPWRGDTLRRPEVVLPLTAVAVAGFAASLLYPNEDANFYESTKLPLFSNDVPRWTAFAAGEAYYAASFYPVGIGEEALFRGVIQTTAEEWFGPTWGWVAASVLFGSLHALSGDSWETAAAAAIATGAVGGYMGWLYQRDGYDLSAGVFFHVWYDVIVGTSYFLADPKNQPFSAQISVPF